MKKTLTIILALALVMGLSVPAFAAEEHKTDLSFTYTVASPTYTVTIPGSMALEFGYNYLPITVSDMENLGGKTIVITFEGNQHGPFSEGSIYYDSFLWKNGINNKATNLTYSLYIENGECYGYYNAIGEMLLTFQDNGTKELTVGVPVNSNVEPNTPYTGWVIFGIKCE